MCPAGNSPHTDPDRRLPPRPPEPWTCSPPSISIPPRPCAPRTLPSHYSGKLASRCQVPSPTNPNRGPHLHPRTPPPCCPRVGKRLPHSLSHLQISNRLYFDTERC